MNPLMVVDKVYTEVLTILEIGDMWTLSELPVINVRVTREELTLLEHSRWDDPRVSYKMWDYAGSKALLLTLQFGRESRRRSVFVDVFAER